MKNLCWKFCLLLLFTFSTVLADEIIVDHAGSGDFTSIQAAINSPDTSAGDTVIVLPGTYFGNVNLLGKAITLRSTDPNNTEIVNSTILDCDEDVPVISCVNNETYDTVIAGFVITHGDTGFCCGMYNYNSSPTVKSCLFAENDYEFGGGIYNKHYSNPVIKNCKFTENAAIAGGGIYKHNFKICVSTFC